MRPGTKIVWLAVSIVVGLAIWKFVVGMTTYSAMVSQIHGYHDHVAPVLSIDQTEYWLTMLDKAFQITLLTGGAVVIIRGCRRKRELSNRDNWIHFSLRLLTAMLLVFAGAAITGVTSSAINGVETADLFF